MFAGSPIVRHVFILPFGAPTPTPILKSHYISLHMSKHCLLISFNQQERFNSLDTSQVVQEPEVKSPTNSFYCVVRRTNLLTSSKGN